ncbi:MAG TPA: OmpA family protein [Candidatus Treponema faecavium]|nr:OmpA family protein [Candidatus Treponema faecavium]
MKNTGIILLLLCVCSAAIGQEQDEYGFLLFELNDTAFVRPDLAAEQLDGLAQTLSDLDLHDGQIHVVGYAAKVDNHINEWVLSRERAQKVIDELVQRNIPARYFAPAEGLGSTYRWGNNLSEQERRRNRRVIVLVDTPRVPAALADEPVVANTLPQLAAVAVTDSGAGTEESGAADRLAAQSSYILISPPLEGMTEESTISDYENIRREMTLHPEYAALARGETASAVGASPSAQAGSAGSEAAAEGAVSDARTARRESSGTDARTVGSDGANFAADARKTSETVSTLSSDAAQGQAGIASWSDGLLGFTRWMLIIIGIAIAGVIVWSIASVYICGKRRGEDQRSE